MTPEEKPVEKPSETTKTKPVEQPPPLPEGVVVIRDGIAEIGEYEFSARGPKGKQSWYVFRVESGKSTPVMVVGPAEGYIFQLDGRTGTYVSVKRPKPLVVSATVSFQVSTPEEHRLVEAALGKLKQVPGFVSVEKG